MYWLLEVGEAVSEPDDSLMVESETRDLGSGVSWDGKKRDSELKLRPGETSLGRPGTESLGRLGRGLSNNSSRGLSTGSLETPKLGE